MLGQHHRGESLFPLPTAGFGEVLRGVSFSPIVPFDGKGKTEWRQSGRGILWIPPFSLLRLEEAGRER